LGIYSGRFLANTHIGANICRPASFYRSWLDLSSKKKIPAGWHRNWGGCRHQAKLYPLAHLFTGFGLLCYVSCLGFMQFVAQLDPCAFLWDRNLQTVAGSILTAH